MFAFDYHKSTAPIFRPLIPLAVFFAAGIGLGACRPGCVWLPAVAVICFVIVILVLLLLRREALICPLLFTAALGYLTVQPWLATDVPDNHVSRFAEQGKWTITARLAGPPKSSGSRHQFVTEVETLSKEGRQLPVSGRVRVSTRGELPGIQRGDKIVFSGHLHGIRNFGNPGGFDYERYMAFQTIRTRVYTKSQSIQIIAKADTIPWQRHLDRWRAALGLRMDAALTGYSPGTRAVLKTLIIGNRSQVSDDLQQAFNRSGVAHVLAISGLHVGMVAVSTFILAAWMLAWIPWMLRYAWTRKAASVLSMVAVMMYALLAGLAPSTQRAAIMIAALLLVYWIGRPHDWLNALALAALLILLIHPPALMSVSFQLSFAAVAAIITGLSVFSFRPPYPSTFQQRMMCRLGNFIWVSALAMAGTLPIVMFYFNQVSLVGLAANLAVVPLVSLIVVPCGLLGVLMSSVGTTLASLCWQVAALGLDGVIWIVTRISLWSYAAVQTIKPSLIEIILYFSLIWLLLNWRKQRLQIFVLSALLLFIAVDAAYWSFQRYAGRKLSVTILDVGQGSANVIRMPAGFTMLVDGGGFSDNNAFDVGRYILAPYLLRHKIKTIDLMVLTHPNSDHLNGLLYLIEHFNVREIWSNHQPAETAGYGNWKQIIADRDIRHVPFRQLPRKLSHSGVEVVILAPPPNFMQRGKNEPWRDLNANSMVTQVEMGKVSILFTGDIDQDAEADLVARSECGQLKSTVLVVPHHGSRHSSSRRFLEAVGAREAIIPAGWRNRFGFPHRDVLERLKDSDCRIWRTDQCGAVSLTTDGENYEIHSWRPGCR